MVDVSLVVLQLSDTLQFVLTALTPAMPHMKIDTFSYLFISGYSYSSILSKDNNSIQLNVGNYGYLSAIYLLTHSYKN